MLGERISSLTSLNLTTTSPNEDETMTRIARTFASALPLLVDIRLRFLSKSDVLGTHHKEVPPRSEGEYEILERQSRPIILVRNEFWRSSNPEQLKGLLSRISDGIPHSLGQDQDYPSWWRLKKGSYRIDLCSSDEDSIVQRAQAPTSESVPPSL
jgi:hypothetical protein